MSQSLSRQERREPRRGGGGRDAKGLRELEGAAERGQRQPGGGPGRPAVRLRAQRPPPRAADYAGSDVIHGISDHDHRRVRFGQDLGWIKSHTGFSSSKNYLFESSRRSPATSSRAPCWAAARRGTSSSCCTLSTRRTTSSPTSSTARRSRPWTTTGTTRRGRRAAPRPRAGGGSPRTPEAWCSSPGRGSTTGSSSSWTLTRSTHLSSREAIQ